LDGFGKTEDYVKTAAKMGFTHLAISNHGNIDSVIKFQNACEKYKITPIFAMEAYMVPDVTIREKGEKRAHIVLYARNQTGWENILKLVTKSYLEGFYYKPRISPSWLYEHIDGLLITTACSSSFLVFDWGEEVLQNLIKLNKENIFLEIMPHQFPEQIELNKKCLSLSKKYDLKMVVSNDAHVVNQEDSICQEVLLAVQTKKLWSDPNRWKFQDSGSYYLKDKMEMAQGFRKQGVLEWEDYNGAFKNTLEIAEKCSGFTHIDKKRISLPVVPELAWEDDVVALKKLCLEGFAKLKINVRDRETYQKRLDEELKLIIAKDFTRYFLIVWEVVKWCKENDVMTGFNRGSAGSSLVCYCLGITKIDPIKYNLLFARFISSDRIDYPDCDLDIEDIKRHLVKEHIEQIYGKHNVAGLSTFSIMKGKGAIRDVSRVFSIPLIDVNIVCKALESKLKGDEGYNHTVSDTFNDTEEGKRFTKKYPEIAEIAIKMEGTVRNCVDGRAYVYMLNSKNKIKRKMVQNLYNDDYKDIKIRAYDFKNDRLFFDNIEEILYKGEQETIEFHVGKNKVSITKDHKILTKSGWKEAKDIVVDEYIAFNGIKKNNIPWNKGLKNVQTPWNKGLRGVMKAWNKGLTKETNEIARRSSERMKKNNPMFNKESREKQGNKIRKHGFYSKDFKYYLKNKAICNRCGSNKKLDVHHRDRDHKNNNIGNWEILCKKCHAKEHNHKMEINPEMTIKYRKVKRINSSGKKYVYDIVMKSENHNFVCEKFILHNCGTHASAIIIANEDLRNGKQCALRLGKDKEPIINWDKDDAEYMGLMKIDFLGLSMLSILKEAKNLIKENHDIDIDYDNISLDDKRVYYQFSKGNNIGCFQVGSPGLIEYCQKLEIESFDMLVHAVALYRPGTLKNGESEVFIQRKRGDRQVPKQHPLVDKITKDTYGILLYQEQIMQLANEVAGLDWAVAEKIRKIIAKSKGQEALRQYADQFINGCVKNKTLDEEEATNLWEQIVTCGDYIFNLSHACGYSIITYFCQWLKVYYPTEFICALLTFGSEDEDKKQEYIEEAFRLGIEVRPPKLGISDSYLWAIKNDILYTPFIEIKGIGDKTAVAFTQSESNVGFYKKDGKDKKISSKFMKILDEIKAKEDIPVDKEQIEKLTPFFKFSFENKGKKWYKD
jgi:DNA polymerase III alpha subunit